MKRMVGSIYYSVLGLALLWSPVRAQVPEQRGDDALLDRLERKSMLTYDARPFHAILEIGPEATEIHLSPGGDYKGRVEVWWDGPESYRLTARAPDFTLDRQSASGHVTDRITGDYYPGWLETFVSLLVDPVPTERFRASTGATLSGGPIGNGGFLQRCFVRDDRPNGITDDLTWAHLCFDQSATRIEYLVTLNRFYALKDWADFDGKTIARSYQTNVLDRQEVVGHLTTLESLLHRMLRFFCVRMTKLRRCRSPPNLSRRTPKKR